MAIEIVNLRKKLDLKKNERISVEMSLQREQEYLVEKQYKKTVIDETNTILKIVITSVQNNVHKSITDIVTRCLRSVFGDSGYDVEMVFESKRGKVEASIQFKRDGYVYDPMDSTSGGVKEVASFGFRLAAIMLSQPKRRRLMILDEPFSGVSEEFKPSLVELLELLAKELEFQLFVVTHIEEFKVGKVIKLG
jgi:DNA repair exonuclease SbcCD ATPase subunit